VHPLSFDQFTLGDREAEGASPESWWFVLQGTRLLVSRAGGQPSIPLAADLGGLGISAVDPLYLGIADGRPCRAVEAPAGQAVPDGWSFEQVRSLFGLIGDRFFTAASRALQLLEWERARECGACGELFYPRISPAAIVAVVRADQLLLARARRFPYGFYSVLAGFVEPGETLEQCVQREVREETAVEVKNIRYFASQPWPFPHSLMVAFTADYAGGEIRCQDGEIADARWFAVDHLPALPHRLSVARRLIDHAVADARGPSPIAESTSPEAR